jgi:hypothetical protein
MSTRRPESRSVKQSNAAQDARSNRMRNTVELRKTKTDDKLKRLRNIGDSDTVQDHVGSGADGSAAQLDVRVYPCTLSLIKYMMFSPHVYPSTKQTVLIFCGIRLPVSLKSHSCCMTPMSKFKKTRLVNSESFFLSVRHMTKNGPIFA